MFTFIITQHPISGADIARITLDDGTCEVVSRNGATMKLARKLRSDGVLDGPWRAVSSDGKLRFYGPSLHRLAELTITETDRVGPKLARFKPFDGVAQRRSGAAADTMVEVVPAA